MKISNLCTGYGKKTVISNFSLEVKPGEKLIIAGANGCGKTTLLKCILGIIKPITGQISLEKGETIAYCKQDFPNSEFPITAAEVVAMGISRNQSGVGSASERIDEALKKAGALELKNRLFYTLSGGERQKVSLARCYCQNASLLLLDEPSSFLDTKSKVALINQMKALEKEAFSVIAVTHDEEIIEKLGWKTVRGELWKD